MGVRKEGDCDLSPIWPRLRFPSTLGVLTMRCPAPSLPVTCCWTVAQVPPPGGTWLSVQAKLTLNKFQYTLYKKARSTPHLTHCPPCERKLLSEPSASVGRRARRNSLVSQWPATSTHKAIVATGGIGMTPSRPGRWEEGMASGSCAPSEPSLSPPGIYSPESPLSSCSLNSTVGGWGGGRGSCKVAREELPSAFPLRRPT